MIQTTKNMAKNKDYLKFILIFVILGIITVYTVFNSRLLINGPQVTVFEPQDGSVLEDPFIEIKGEAKNISFINLDGDPFFINEDGKFSEKLLLSPGLSIIKIDAKDKFGREEVLLLRYIYNGTSTYDTNSIDIEVSEKSLEEATSTDKSLEDVE